MGYSGVYIDDNDDDLTYGELMSVPGNDGIIFKNIKPKSLAHTAQQISEFSPDIVAIDYRLDERQNTDAENDYRAGTLAQNLREKLIDQPAKDFPIILISTEEKIHKFFEPDQTSHDLFDEWYRKETITSDGEKVRTQILSLIRGYKKIAENIGNDKWPISLLNLNEDEDFIIELTNLDIELKESNVAHIWARVLLNNIIKRSGLLLKPEDLYAKLGIELDDYTEINTEIFTKLDEEDICYKGIFSDGWKRVWKHRFEAWLKGKLKQHITGIAVKQRVAKINKLFGTKFKPASSLWTKTKNELPSFACASCKHPTELRNSVAAYDPRLPVYIEKKRICFDCIESDKYERVRLQIAKEDHNLVEQIKNGKIPRE